MLRHADINALGDRPRDHEVTAIVAVRDHDIPAGERRQTVKLDIRDSALRVDVVQVTDVGEEATGLQGGAAEPV